MMIGGYIANFAFHRLAGNLSPQVLVLENVRELWEDGEVFQEGGRHGPVCTLEGSVDLIFGGAIPGVMFAYAQLIGNYVLVQQRRGSEFAQYPNWLVLNVEDVTPEEKKAMGPDPVGGVNGGRFWLYSRWTLQYPLPA